MPRLLIPTPLRTYTGGAAIFDGPADSVHDLLVGLTDTYPALRNHLLDDSGEVRSFLRIYLGDTDIDEFEGIRTQLAPDAEVVLVPAIAGGTVIPTGPWVR